MTTPGSGTGVNLLNNIVHNITTTSEKTGNAFGIAVYGTSSTPITKITISGNQGQDSKNGVTISWAFDPVAQTLDLQCLDKPFILPCGTITGRIQDVVDSCLQQLA